MAEANWTFMANSLGGSNTARGVTSGVTKPPGGQTYAHGFNSLNTTPGAVALYTSQVSFVPTALGGSIRAAIKRGASAGPLNYSCFLFIGAQGSSTNDEAYMLGLSDSTQPNLICRKGQIVAGIVEGELGDQGIIMKSADTFAEDTWYHIRMDMIVNPSGDVLIQVFQNDLNVNDVTTPVWDPINGMPSFTDDPLQIATGSAPFTAGFMGFGFQTADIQRRSFFDYIECLRQV